MLSHCDLRHDVIILYLVLIPQARKLIHIVVCFVKSSFHSIQLRQLRVWLNWILIDILVVQISRYVE